MGKSQRIRLRDVRNVFRVVNECRDNWADPDAWRERLLYGAADLCESPVGTWSTLPPPSSDADAVDRDDPVALGQWGMNEQQAEHWQASWYARPRPAFPGFEQCLDRMFDTGAAVFDRRELCPDDEFRAGALYQRFMRHSDQDAFVISMRFSRAPDRAGCIDIFCVARWIDDRPFAQRSARLLRILHDEVHPLIGTELATAAQYNLSGLSPRCRETLEFLLDGASEKEIARALGLSRHTVHDYVKQIHAHFDVDSRGELLAYFIRRRPNAAARRASRQ